MQRYFDMYLFGLNLALNLLLFKMPQMIKCGRFVATMKSHMLEFSLDCHYLVLLGNRINLEPFYDDHEID